VTTTTTATIRGYIPRRAKTIKVLANYYYDLHATGSGTRSRRTPARTPEADGRGSAGGSQSERETSGGRKGDFTHSLLVASRPKE
jgi:hypothetical protein